MLWLLFGAALLAAQTEAQSASAEAPTTDSPAWIEAKANRPKLKQAPALKDGPVVDLPEAERAAGHHGTVLIEGIVGIDGTMSEARIRQTSKAVELDRLALEAAQASTFIPAMDAQGNPLAVVVTMPFDLVGYKSREGMGINQYRCDQFIRDMDWWQSVNPDAPFKNHELYQLHAGLQFAAAVNRTHGIEDLQKVANGFETRWIKAIALCRKKPDMLQRDAIFR